MMNSMQGHGTIGWTAQEIVHGGVIAEKADVYSFGMIMNLLLNGSQPPYDNLEDDEQVAGLVLADARGTSPFAAKVELQPVDDVDEPVLSL